MVVAMGAALALAGIALAVGIGLQNSGFESDFDSWTVKTVRPAGNNVSGDDQGKGNRQVVYGPGGEKGASVPCEEGDRYGICVVDGDDVFVDQDSGQTVTVSPTDGSKMARLGGPYTSRLQTQRPVHEMVLEQTFTVDSAAPVVQLNYNVFTYDYSGFDEARFLVRVTDEQGDVLVRDVQGAFGPSGDTRLKTTGWQPNSIDMTGYEGQQVNLQIQSLGTRDELYGFWTYVDAGTIPSPPVSGDDVGAEAPNTPGGSPVIINQQVNPGTNQTFLSIGNGAVNQFTAAEGFPNGMPLNLTVPVDPGSSTISNVEFTFNSGAPRFDATETAPGSGIWGGQVFVPTNPTFQPRTIGLNVEYDLSEPGQPAQHFIVPIGGIVLIDPQGVVYDKVEFDQAIANGQTPEQARATAAIQGATVRLQRQQGASFVNVLSGDPGISPKVNPQTTPSSGLYQWDVSAGTYRVVVAKSGFQTVTSQSVDIPPPVLDLHIPMVAPSSGGGPGTGGTGGTGGDTGGTGGDSGGTGGDAGGTAGDTGGGAGATGGGEKADAACEEAEAKVKKAEAALKKAKAALKKAKGKKALSKAKKKVAAAKKQLKAAEAEAEKQCSGGRNRN